MKERLLTLRNMIVVMKSVEKDDNGMQVGKMRKKWEIQSEDESQQSAVWNLLVKVRCMKKVQ